MIPLFFISITILCFLLSLTCGKKSKNAPNLTNPDNTATMQDTPNIQKISPVLPPEPPKTVKKEAQTIKLATTKVKAFSKTALLEEAEWIDPNDSDNQGEVEFKDFDDTEVDTGGDSAVKNQDIEPAKWTIKEDQERHDLIQAGKLVKHKRDPEYVTIAGDIPEIDMDPGYEEDESAKKKPKKPKNKPKAKQPIRKKGKEVVKAKASSRKNKKKSSSEKDKDSNWELENQEKNQQIREGKLFVDKRDPMYVTIGANAGIPELQLDDDEKGKLKKVQSKVKSQKAESISYQPLNPDKTKPKANVENTYFTLDF